MNSHFDGRWLEWGPPPLPPHHSGGLHLAGDQAGGQVAHLPEKGEKKSRKKKPNFLFIFHFRFFIQRQFSHAAIFPVTIDHKAARNTPQMCTPGGDSADRSWLSISEVGLNPCRAHFSPLTMQYRELVQVERSLLQMSNR